MEIIKGLLRKNIVSIIINNLIFFTSFVFTNISLTIGLQLDSGVGYFVILTTIAYLIMIATTVLTFQIIIDRKVWETLYRYGLLENDGRKIVMALDLTFLCVSLPTSLICSNYVIVKLMNANIGIWKNNLIFLGIEACVFCCAYMLQCFYIGVLQNEEKNQTSSITKEHIPLFLKNVLRNKSRMMLVTNIICFGMIVFNSILFVISCDNSQVYIDKAISVDYFLTACDTRNTVLRSEEQIVEESDINVVTGIDAYEEGGRLYHSVTPIASLITDLLPETSKFSVFDGLPIEKNEAGNYFVNLYGADDFVIENMELYEGSIDLDKIATGNYIIYGLSRKQGTLAYTGDVSDEWKYFDVGDEITLEGNNNSKKYTIMAICKVNHTYTEQYEYTYPGHELIFYLPSNEYLTYVESAKDGENQPMRYLFNTIDSQNIDDELQGLSFESRRKWTEDYLKELDGILGGTFLFAVGCAVIGFFVFVNTMIISYLDRKKEFDILGNLGMTSKQINAMVLGEGFTYGLIISVIIAIGVGIVEILGKSILVGESWNYRIVVSPMFICIVTIIAIAMLTPMIVYKIIR
ncbi:MAG: ABC transporter permease [Lachnospiraceae bacterium]|nr:ABC transporter permease [Lachnospiraceae bacterium]